MAHMRRQFEESERLERDEIRLGTFSSPAPGRRAASGGALYFAWGCFRDFLSRPCLAGRIDPTPTHHALAPRACGTTSAYSTNAPQPWAAGRALFKSSRRTSVRQRIGPELDVHGARHRALAAFLEPGRAVAVGAPQPAAFPAGIRIVDPPIEALGVEAERIGNPDRDHLAVLQRHEAVTEVGGGDRDVLAKSGGVVLVDPGVIARLGAVLADAVEAGAGILMDGPAFRAMIAGGGRPVERALALVAVEAGEG